VTWQDQVGLRGELFRQKIHSVPLFRCLKHNGKFFFGLSLTVGLKFDPPGTIPTVPGAQSGFGVPPGPNLTAD
jgi:hypothetical protein